MVQVFVLMGTLFNGRRCLLVSWTTLLIGLSLTSSISLHSFFHFGWQWNFRIGFTPREGLVIYSVAYIDGSRGRRPVAHRLSFVEMVVPYGDPNEPHYRKNAFDAGEDGLGKNAHSLKKVGIPILPPCISAALCRVVYNLHFMWVKK